MCLDICLQTYLLLEATSFPRAKLEENCELQGTDNVQGQISEHIFAPNGGYCVYYSKILFTMSAVLKIGEYSQIFPVLAGEYSVT